MDVAVVIASLWERHEMLTRALESVRNQDVGRPETHVVLGLERLPAYDAGLHVEAPFVTWLDDDDYWTPNHLGAMLTAQRRDDADVVYCKGIIVQDKRQTIFGADPPDELPTDYDFIYGGFMYRSELLRELGGFPRTDLGGSLHMRAWKLGAKFAFTRSVDPTLVVNYHGANTGLTLENYFV